MIFAPADAHPCTPICNLSTAYKRCGTYTNLCSTIKSTWGTYCNLPTAIDPDTRCSFHRPNNSEPLIILARTLYIPFDRIPTVGLIYSLGRHIMLCPPANTEPFDPILTFGRILLSPFGPNNILGSTIMNPSLYIMRNWAVIYSGCLKVIHSKNLSDSPGQDLWACILMVLDFGLDIRCALL